MKNEVRKNIRIIELADQLSGGYYPTPVKDKDTMIKNMEAMEKSLCESVKTIFKNETGDYGWRNRTRQVYDNACRDEDVCRIVLSINDSDDTREILDQLSDDIYDMKHMEEIDDINLFMESIRDTAKSRRSAYIDYICRANGHEKLLGIIAGMVPIRDAKTGKIRIAGKDRYGTYSEDSISPEELFAMAQIDDLHLCFESAWETMNYARKCEETENFANAVNFLHGLNAGSYEDERIMANELIKLDGKEIDSVFCFMQTAYSKMSLYYSDTDEKNGVFHKILMSMTMGEEITPDIMKAFSNRLTDGKGREKTSKADLDALAQKESIAYTMDFVRGSRYTDIIDEAYGNTSNLIVDRLIYYGLVNEKYPFLNLIRSSMEDFKNLRYESLIYERDFTRICNVNTLSKKNIQQMAKKDKKSGKTLLSSSRCSIGVLVKSGRIYTFEEIETVSTKPEAMQRLYVSLDIPSVDRRLLTFRQLTHQRLMRKICELPDNLLNGLAKALSKQTFREFCENTPCYDGTNDDDMIELMAVSGIDEDYISNAISKAKDATDARLIVKNYGNEKLKEIGLAEFRKNYLSCDKDAKWLIRNMGYDDKTVETYYDSLLQFCMDGTHAIVRRYHETVNSAEQQKNILLLASAAVQGKLDLVKYKDFSKELQYDISDEMLNKWKKNLSVSGVIEAAEYDDFRSCISIGERTGRTCMSYNGGAYNECCLATFDGNKKVIYAMEDGDYVGRAILRLTKYSKSKDADDSLSFMDVSENKEENDDNSRLILFLEKMYFKNTGHPDKVRKQIIKLARMKAEEMGIGLAVAADYESAVNTVQTEGYIYVSKSKNGKQYLDSFGGSCHTGGFYKHGTYHFVSADAA